MSHSIEIHNTVMEMLLTTDREINADAPVVLSLYQSLKEFEESAGVKDIRFTQDIGDPNLYAYRVELKDLRISDITVLFSGPQDMNPLVTINIPVAWELTILASVVRGLANQLIDIHTTVGIESFVVVFT